MGSVGLRFNDKDLHRAKQFRKYLTKEKYKTPCSEQFWQNKFNVTLSKEHWSLAINVTSESRLRELQWKILHNIYPTNILLSKMGLATSKNCSFCPEKVDYLEHFFCECVKITELWRYIENCFYVKYNVKVQLSTQDILLGKDRSTFHYFQGDMWKFLNHLILVGKMCVSKFKYGKQTAILVMFENEVKLRNL